MHRYLYCPLCILSMIITTMYTTALMNCNRTSMNINHCNSIGYNIRAPSGHSHLLFIIIRAIICKRAKLIIEIFIMTFPNARSIVLGMMSTKSDFSFMAVHNKNHKSSYFAIHCQSDLFVHSVLRTVEKIEGNFQFSACSSIF